MKKLTRLALLAFPALMLWLTGCNSNKSATAAQGANENFIFWEVTGNGLSKPSYMFGTLHALTNAYTDSFPVINEKLRKADAVVGEIKIDSSQMMAMAFKMMSLDSPLNSLLSKEEMDLVKQALGEISPQMEMGLNLMKPMAIQALIMQKQIAALAPDDAGGSGQEMDVYFQNQGKKLGKHIYGLETLDYQVSLLFGKPLKEQARDLMEMLKDSSKTGNEMANMLSCYRKADVNCLSHLMDDAKTQSPEFESEFVTKRNNDWMTKLPAMMKSESLFVAVGALHLSGPNGLVTQLRKKGYTVKGIALLK